MLVGAWDVRDAQLVADEVCAQIELLTTGRLRKVAMRDGGWVQLFLDPLDGSFWELSYSHKVKYRAVGLRRLRRWIQRCCHVCIPSWADQSLLRKQDL